MNDSELYEKMSSKEVEERYNNWKNYDLNAIKNLQSEIDKRNLDSKEVIKEFIKEKNAKVFYSFNEKVKFEREYENKSKMKIVSDKLKDKTDKEVIEMSEKWIDFDLETITGIKEELEKRKLSINVAVNQYVESKMKEKYNNEIAMERNDAVYILMFLLVFILEVVPKLFFRILELQVDIQLISSFGMIASFFIIRAGLIEYNKEEFTTKNVFFNISGKDFLNFLMALISVKLLMILFAKLPLVGIVLIIFIGLKLIFVPYIIVDKKISFVEGIKESFNITKGNIGKIITKYIILIIILIGVGLINYFLQKMFLGKDMNMFSYALMAVSNKLPIGVIIWESIVNSIFTIIITFYFVNLYKEISNEVA